MTPSPPTTSRINTRLTVLTVAVLTSLLGCELRDNHGANDGALGTGPGGAAGMGGAPDSGSGGEGGAGGPDGAGGTAGNGGAAGMGGVPGTSKHEVLELDPSFGTDGIQTFSVHEGPWTSEGARAIAVLPDDRIVVVGTTHDSTFGPTHGFVALLGDAGPPDTSFGTDGEGVVHESFDENTEYSAVTLDGEGRIVVAGWSKSNRPSDDGSFTLARYLPDGSRDDSFGTDRSHDGVTRLSEPCSVKGTDLAIQTDGRIVATGTACGFNERLSAIRVGSDGAPDDTFGDTGVLLLDEGYGDEVLLARDAMGSRRILVGGSVGEVGFNGTLDFAIAGLTDSGQNDDAFGDEGMVVTDFGDGSPGRSEGLNAMTLTPNGSIVAAGWAQLLSNFFEPWVYSYDMLVVAYDSNGVLDTSFGDQGATLVDFGSDSEDAVEILRRDNGNLVAVGGSHPFVWDREIAIAHLTADGQPVEVGHKTLTGIDGAGLNAQGATLDNRGRVLVAGYVSYVSGGVDVFVARFVFEEAP